MEPEVIAYTVKEMKADIKDIQTDVKALMLFMAVEKARAKKDAMMFSGCVSLVVSIVLIGVSKLIGG